MGEALHRQRVEHRPCQRGVLQRRLEGLALRPQRGIRRIGPGRRRGLGAWLSLLRCSAPPVRRLPRSGIPRCCASSRTRPITWATSAQPTHPANRRAYSSRNMLSLIRATMGTHRRSAETRPSALSRSSSASAVRITNSNNGVRRATRSRSAPSPDFNRRSHGSIPSSPRRRRTVRQGSAPLRRPSPPPHVPRRRRRRHRSARRERSCRPS